MPLTAREWLLLPVDEQKKRGKELSSEECRKLRMELSEISFSEEEKEQMTAQEKYDFTHPRELSNEEKERNSRNTLKLLQAGGILPQKITWEEWRGKGCPLDWQGNR